MSNFGFKQDERLKSRKRIEALFESGQSLKNFPVLMVFNIRGNEGDKAQVGFSVSKRKFKRAVDRNRIKRLMLESYRLNKGLIAPVSNNNSLEIMFVFLDRSLPEYTTVEASIKQLLADLNKKLSKHE